MKKKMRVPSPPPPPKAGLFANRPLVCLISSLFQLKCDIYPGLASHGGGWGFCIKGLCGPVAMIASSVNLSIPPVVSARLRGGGTGFSCLVLLLAAGQKNNNKILLSPKKKSHCPILFITSMAHKKENCVSLTEIWSYFVIFLFTKNYKMSFLLNTINSLINADQSILTLSLIVTTFVVCSSFVNVLR